MSGAIRDILLGAFTADSLALGAHGEYDQKRIAETLGDVRELLAPTLNAYHPGKKAGDQSHYGDQALWLLRFLKEHGRFDRDLFAARWRENMGAYTGYMDHASKETLRNMGQGIGPQYSGAGTSDFAGPARFVPLVCVHPLKGAAPARADLLIADAKAQTLFTHNNPLLADIAAFFARALYALCNGAGMADAFTTAAAEAYPNLPAGEWLEAARSRLDRGAEEAILEMGQSCSVPGAMQGTLHLAEKYEGDPEEGLVRNAMSGGDSCARGFMLGALFGARHGGGRLPQSWTAALAAREEILAGCGG